MVANYTNKHITFNKGQWIGHMEPWIDKMSQKSVNSVIMQKMMDGQVQLDTFIPPLLRSEMISRWIVALIQVPICESQKKHWHNKSDQYENWHRQLWPCLTETILYCDKILTGLRMKLMAS